MSIALAPVRHRLIFRTVQSNSGGVATYSFLLSMNRSRRVLFIREGVTKHP
jgi:hypothetical protein